MERSAAASERVTLHGLVEEGHLVPTPIAGVYGRGADFEDVLQRFDGLVGRETASDGAELVRFPPVLPRRTLETAGYLGSFPQLAGTVFSFSGDEAEAVDLAARAAGHEDWSAHQSITDVSLVPAACYPVYPWVAAAGPLVAGGRLVDVGGYCYRHEPSADPARMQSFRMRENVRLGDAGTVAAWHAAWIERGADILSSVGLETDVVTANDPFFGRAGRMLRANQRDQGLKLERVHVVAGEDPTAIMSINYHQDHFGQAFDIRLASGEAAHTACIGFGLERVTLALLAVHGLDVGAWPDPVRARLGLESSP